MSLQKTAGPIFKASAPKYLAWRCIVKFAINFCRIAKAIMCLCRAAVSVSSHFYAWSVAAFITRPVALSDELVLAVVAFACIKFG